MSIGYYLGREETQPGEPWYHSMVDRDIMIQERMEHFSSTKAMVKGQWLVGRVLDRELLLFYWEIV